MPGAFTVSAPDFARVAAALKSQSPALRKEFGWAVRKAAANVVAAEKAAALAVDSKGAKASGKAQAALIAFSMGRTKAQRSKSIAQYQLNNLAFRKRVDALGKTVGLRQSIANSIGAIIRYQGKDVGVRVRARSSKMPPGMGNMARNVNRGRWVHPMFGNKSVVVVQKSSPPNWFYTAADRPREQFKKDMEQIVQWYAHLLAESARQAAGKQ